MIICKWLDPPNDHFKRPDPPVDLWSPWSYSCWDVLGVKYEAVAMKCLGTRALGGQGGQVSAVIRVRGGRGGRSHGSRMEHTPGHRSSDTASHCPLMATQLKTKKPKLF